MPDSQPRYVVDTSILIDFHRGALLEASLAVPLTLLAPDVIMEESQVPDGQQLVSWGLQSVSLTGDQVIAVAAPLLESRTRGRAGNGSNLEP